MLEPIHNVVLSRNQMENLNEQTTLDGTTQETRTRLARSTKPFAEKACQGPRSGRYYCIIIIIGHRDQRWTERPNEFLNVDR